MTREEQIRRVMSLLDAAEPFLSRWSMAERIVDALGEPVEVTDEMSAAMSYEDHSSWATAGWGIRGPRNDAQNKSEGNEMTREEQIEQMAQTLCAIRLEQIRTKAPHVANWDRLLESERDEWRWWATKMVDAITQPVEEKSSPTYWPGQADKEEVGPIGDGTPHARMYWFWDRMMPHIHLIEELTAWSPFSSTYRFEEAIADAFDKLAEISKPVEIETIKEFDSAEFGREMDRVIVGLSKDLERLREAAQEVITVHDDWYAAFHDKHFHDKRSADELRQRAFEAWSALRAALEDKT